LPWYFACRPLDRTRFAFYNPQNAKLAPPVTSHFGIFHLLACSPAHLRTSSTFSSSHLLHLTFSHSSPPRPRTRQSPFTLPPSHPLTLAETMEASPLAVNAVHAIHAVDAVNDLS
jgi:hypothetical protein